MLDLVIKNGLVFDGRGAKPRRLDVGIRDGRIAALQPNLDEPAERVLDARDAWVTPGFIDIHTHYDIELEISPGIAESVRHGVTAVVTGNCSLSITLGKAEHLADIFQRVETLSPVLVRKWLKNSCSWNSPREYLDHLSTLKLGPSVAPLLGHSSLRVAVMGLERSVSVHANDDELAQMERLAAEALDAGCIGISIDMVPWHMMRGEFRGRTIPSQHASYREYAMLAKVCRQRDRVFQVTPNPQRLFSLIQILWLSVGIFRRPLRLTILTALDSVAFRGMWRLFGPLLFVFNRVLRGNIRFQTLTEPFTIYADGPITPVFEEFRAGVALNNLESSEERRNLWRTPGFRDRFRADWTGGPLKTFHCDLNAMKILRCPDAAVVGKTFAEVAAARHADPLDVMMDLFEQHDEAVRWVATGGNDRPGPRRKLMSHPEILPGFTDAGAHVRNLGFYDGGLSLLRQMATSGFLTPERAIARISGEAAAWFGLDCGVLEVGGRADVVVLDPLALRTPIPDPVEIADPLLDGSLRMVKRGSEAIVRSVCVSGVEVVRDGEPLATLGQTALGEVLAPSPRALARPKIEMRHRNAISLTLVDHPFTDYWDIFVLKHQHPANLACHFVGVILWYGLALLALATWNWRWLCLLPLSQIVGLLGHFFFERSHVDTRDAVFSFRASRCLNRMFLRLMQGRYGEDLRRTREALERFQIERGFA